MSCIIISYSHSPLEMEERNGNRLSAAGSSSIFFFPCYEEILISLDEGLHHQRSCIFSSSSSPTSHSLKTDIRCIPLSLCQPSYYSFSHLQPLKDPLLSFLVLRIQNLLFSILFSWFVSNIYIQSVFSLYSYCCFVFSSVFFISLYLHLIN